MVIRINQLLLREQSHDRSMQQNFRMKANRNCKLKHMRINSQIPYTHFILAYVCTMFVHDVSVIFCTKQPIYKCFVAGNS